MLALHQRYPTLASLPYIPLGTFPTPVEEVPALAEQSGAAAVWVKRDDISGERYGGNKIRKLEFILGDAKDRGASRLVTVGAIGSHHCLATTTTGGAVGFDLTVHHFPQPVTPHVLHNCLAVSATGAELKLSSKNTLPFALAVAKTRAWLPSRERRYYVPGGGSSPAGVVGYINAALEIEQQIEAGEIPPIDAAVVAVGTAGTMAGLIVGFKLARRPIEIIGVRVIDRLLANMFIVRRLVRKTERLLRKHGLAVAPFDGVRFRLDHTQFGSAYGKTTPACDRAVEAARVAAGLKLDPTYTGKAMAGLLAGGCAGKSVLFVNTLSSRSVEALIPPDYGPNDLPAAYARFFSSYQLPEHPTQ